MKRWVTACLVASLVPIASARADGTSPPLPATIATQTWGVSASRTDEAAPIRPDAPARQARELLTKARRLDDLAANDDKAATELQQRLPALRASAKATRERAERATGHDHEVLVAVAEDFETEVAVSEAEVLAKRSEASDTRRAAHDLRVRAMRVVHEPPPDVQNRLTPDGLVPRPAVDTTRDDHCDPPYRFTPDGRKTYLFECLK